VRQALQRATRSPGSPAGHNPEGSETKRFAVCPVRERSIELRTAGPSSYYPWLEPKRASGKRLAEDENNLELRVRSAEHFKRPAQPKTAQPNPHGTVWIFESAQLGKRHYSTGDNVVGIT
jgi:hypothetical protein